MTPGPARERWGQLSYGSLPADPVTRAGAGWRVKESVGGLSEEESQRLLALAITRFESHVPFPGVGQRAETYEALPRRFGYVPSGSQALYWHATQLDVDGSGRTGNVFSHLLLDRSPIAPSPRHAPVSLWRTPGFLAPHQYALVDGEQLQAEPPGPGPVVTRENLLTFLFDSTYWRVGMLAVLADAVFAALEGGPRVVLRCEDQQEAAMWIGAVNAIQSLRDARRLGFSLYERGTSEHANGVDQAFARGVHIAVVPPGDAYEPSVDVVEIDPHAAVTLGGMGGMHVFEDGRTVAVGAVSSLVTLCLFTAVDAAALFDAVDDVARRTGDCPNLDLAWPFAMAILLHADEYPDAVEFARPVVVRGTPAQVAADAELRALAESATVQALSDDPSVLWGQLQAVPSTSFTYQLVASAYLVSALGAPTWLTEQNPAPLPVTPQNLDAFTSAAVGALDRMLSAEAPDPVGALRLIGFVGRVLGQGPAHPSVESRLEELVARTIEQLIALPGRAVALAAAGPFDDVVLAGWIVPALGRRAPVVPGPSIFSTPPEVLRGLFGTSALLAAGPLAGWTDLQWDAVALTLEHTPDAGLRNELALRLLDRYGNWQSVPRDGQAVLQAASDTWSANELLAVTRTDVSKVPADVVIRVILGSGEVEARAIAVTAGLSDVQRELARLVAEARELEGARRLLTSDEEFHRLQRYLEVLRGLHGRPADREAAFAPAVVVLSIVLRAESPHAAAALESYRELLAPAADKVAASPALTARVTQYLLARAQEDSVRARNLLLALAVLGAGSMGSEFGLSTEERANARLRDAGGERLVDAIVSRVAGGDARSVLSLEDLIRALDARATDDETRADKIAKRWWRARGLGSGINIADSGVEFLGGLFRGRQKGEG